MGSLFESAPLLIEVRYYLMNTTRSNILLIQTGPGGYEGGGAQPRVRLHPAGPDRPEEPLAQHGPAGVLLPLHPPQELVPHRAQDERAADGSVVTCLKFYLYVYSSKKKKRKQWQL